MKFTKMQGTGNDYVYVNCFEQEVENPSSLAPIISDRHTGVGSDGLILVCRSDKADVRMRMFNADGSEAEMCGNGIRCVAKFAYDRRLAKIGDALAVPGQAPCPVSLSIETLKGVLRVGIYADDRDNVVAICVNMGRPILNGPDIPVRIEKERVVNESLQIGEQTMQMTCVSMGNPHAVFFAENLDNIDLCKTGPVIENHELFPARTNVHFVKPVRPDEFDMITWERGSGITQACGTGACACLVATVLTGKGERAALAHLPGGNLQLNWSQEDDCIYMTGPAEEVFEGEWKGPIS